MYFNIGSLVTSSDMSHPGYRNVFMDATNWSLWSCKDINTFFMLKGLQDLEPCFMNWLIGYVSPSR